MTGNGGIGHPKSWVVMRNVKDRMSSSLVDHACCYGHFTLKLSAMLRQVRTRVLELIGSGLRQSSRDIGLQDLIATDTLAWTFFLIHVSPR